MPPRIVAPTDTATFRRFVLDNGLRVLLFPDPSRPTVTVNMTVLVGSRHEGYGEAGMAHLLEHMVFKGTPRRTAFDVNRDFDSIGADYNAFTSEENTVFHAAVLPEYLPEAVDIVADILRPSLRADDFEM